MAQDNYRKIKLLKLLELLRLDTDEQHPMTTNQICTRLDEMGIICDRRTLSKDIALLNEQGYEIMDTTVGHEKGYYIDDRGFSVPELKILIDAVHASSFITEKKSEELIDKLVRDRCLPEQEWHWWLPVGCGIWNFRSSRNCGPALWFWSAVAIVSCLWPCVIMWWMCWASAKEPDGSRSMA